MSDDDKTTTDEPTGDAADEAAVEPAVEPETEAKEEVVEVAAEEPKAEEVAEDASAPATTSATTAEPAGTDQQGRTLYNVKCTNCGKDTQVPFQPAGDRPVYCRDCYMQKKNS